MSIKDDLLTEGNIELFRRTFSTVEGKKALGIILFLGGFFNDNINNEQDEGKRNLCTTLLKFMGVEETTTRSSEFVSTFVNAISSLTIKHKEETKK